MNYNTRHITPCNYSFSMSWTKSPSLLHEAQRGHIQPLNFFLKSGLEVQPTARCATEPHVWQQQACTAVEGWGFRLLTVTEWTTNSSVYQCEAICPTADDPSTADLHQNDWKRKESKCCRAQRAVHGRMPQTSMNRSNAVKRSGPDFLQWCQWPIHSDASLLINAEMMGCLCLYLSRFSAWADSSPVREEHPSSIWSCDGGFGTSLSQCPTPGSRSIFFQTPPVMQINP